MRQTLSLLFLLSLVSHVLAVDSIYIREYTYDASELDSRSSARNNALKLMKAELLEEISSYIISEQDLRRKFHNDRIIHQAESHVKSISVGRVRSQVMEESWNGKTFWLKAELTVDKAAVARTMQQYLYGARNKEETPKVIPNIATIPMTSPSYDGYQTLAKLANVMSLLAPIRIRSMQYFQFQNKWPSDLESLGFKSSSMTDGETIDNVVLGPDGEVKALLNKQFGKQKYLSLKPRKVMGGSSTRWDCYTNLPTELFMIPGAFPCKTD